ncbi:MAG: hypothetical protein KC425_11040, partial [Anaerolineales bacterium]|nr:hypothetical protein [Anaerolineales bacterium]
MRRAICCTWLSSLLLLVMAGCWPGPADGTATPPLPTATPPAAATAAPISSTPVATATLPAVALPEVETAVSTQPPLPLALRWRRAAAGGAAAVDLFSLDGGPLPDVLLGSGGGQVITLGLAQDVYWQTDLGQRVTQLFGADFDNDLIGDVVVGGDDSQVRVLEGGIERWAARTSGRVTALLRWPEAPPGPAIIAASGDGDLQALTRDGELLWQVSGALDAYVTQLLAADVNADGETDLLAVSAAGQVRAWTAAGDSLWTADLGGGARQAAAVDFNGDGAAELVAGTAGGDLVALTSTGGAL